VLSEKYEASNPCTADPHVKTAVVLFTKAVSKSFDTGIGTFAVLWLAATAFSLLITGHGFGIHRSTNPFYRLLS
jgi:hypothetical protein